MGKLSKELKMGIHNRFDIEVVDIKTGKIKQKARGFNTVCNGYYNTVGSYRNIYPYHSNFKIAFGSGTGTPAATDTALFSRIDVTGYDSTYNPSDTLDDSREKEGIWVRRCKRTIPNTQAIGSTITEVGFQYENTLLTHAMLEDMNGNPISIAHTSTDIINIYCSIYLHYAGQDSGIRLYNTYINYYSSGYRPREGSLVRRFLLMSMSDQAANQGASRYRLAGEGTASDAKLDSATYDPDNTALNDSNFSYNSTTKTLTLTLPQMAISKNNTGWATKILIDYSYDTSNWNYIPTPNARSIEIKCGSTVLPAFTMTSESVGVGDGTTTKFKTKFARPYNATVKVNGVAQQSGVTVKKWGILSATQGGEMWEYTFANEANRNGVKDFKYIKFVAPDKLDWEVIGSYTKVNNSALLEVLDPEIGVHHIYAPNGKIKGSNDGTTWYDVETINAGTAQMNQAGAHYRYYKAIDSGDDYRIYINEYDGNNIIFDTPPAQGDVITIDYTTDCIPKDVDHVLDITLTFTFGEWTGV